MTPITKYAGIVFMPIAALFLVMIALVVIHTRIPTSRGLILLFNFMFGFGLLALAFCIIWWWLTFFDPPHSDFQNAANPPLPTPPACQVHLSKPVGFAASWF